MPRRSILRPRISLIIALLLMVILSVDIFFDISGKISFFFRKKPEVAIVKYFTFSSPNSLSEWEDKIFHKKVEYSINTLGSESFVRAVSEGAGSAKYYRISLDARNRPIISWKWRVERFPDKKLSDDLLSKDEDDFAARVYVIFPALFFANSKALEYIWAKDIDVDTVSSSPYSSNIKLIVAESGINEEPWTFEERNIYDDYISAFGSKPKLRIGAIAFMCDSDSTKSSAKAYFDEIKIYYKKDAGG